MGSAIAEYVLFGGGGHAKVVRDAAEKSMMRIKEVFVDRLKEENDFYGCSIFLEKDFEHKEEALYHIAIGDNATRKRMALQYTNLSYFTVIHPTAILASDVTIGQGCFIGPGAILNANATIGDHVIINSGAIIEHDVAVGSYSHICPGAVLAGEIVVGEGVMVGAGTAVIPRMTIGDWAIIGAGSGVVRPIQAGMKQGGVPCRDLSSDTKS